MKEICSRTLNHDVKFFGIFISTVIIFNSSFMVPSTVSGQEKRSKKKCFYEVIYEITNQMKY